MKPIIYTRHDGGVSVCYPSRNALLWMARGGRWNDMPHGYVQTQIERQIADGISPDHAVRFARAMAFGGLTEAEALGVIKDRDCARHGTLHELIDPSDLPDRWFRDAWRRSSYGGPPSVDLEKARNIQWQRVLEAVSQENRRREFDLFGPAPITLNRVEYQTAIRHARDDEELRKVWPPGLSSPQS